MLNATDLLRNLQTPSNATAMNRDSTLGFSFEQIDFSSLIPQEESESSAVDLQVSLALDDAQIPEEVHVQTEELGLKPEEKLASLEALEFPIFHADSDALPMEPRFATTGKNTTSTTVPLSPVAKNHIDTGQKSVSEPSIIQPSADELSTESRKPSELPLASTTASSPLVAQQFRKLVAPTVPVASTTFEPLSAAVAPRALETQFPAQQPAAEQRVASAQVQMLPALEPTAAFIPPNIDQDIPTEARPVVHSLDTGAGITEPKSAMLSPAIPADIGVRVSPQIADAIRQTRDGQVEISLSPEELGRVKLVINGNESSVSVSIQSERPETLDLIRRHINQLHRELLELGYAEISFNFDQEKGGRQEHEALSEPLDDSLPSTSHATLERTTRQETGQHNLDIRL